MIGDNRFFRNTKNQTGFTLVEVLVVVAIFSVVVVSVINLFLLGSRAQRRVEGREAVASAARSVIETMARDVRNGGVDYGRYQSSSIDLTQPTDVLHLKQGKRWYTQSTDGCLDAQSTPCVVLTEATDPNSQETTASITPRNMMVETFQVRVSPAISSVDINPATGQYPSDVAQVITILLTLRATAGPAAGELVTVQTSVAPRLYVR